MDTLLRMCSTFTVKVVRVREAAACAKLSKIRWAGHVRRLEDFC